MATNISTLVATLTAAAVATRFAKKAFDLVNGVQNDTINESEPVKFNISTLFSPSKHDIDIVFVHGLRTDSTLAWSDPDSSTNNQFCWPLNHLPEKLRWDSKVDARILAYDYDTKFRTVEYLTRRTLLHQAGGLVDALVRYREPGDRRPIVFVCHSLGGLLVKNALVSARSSREDGPLNVFKATAGIVFLGTPHDGSPEKLAESLRRILNFSPKDKPGMEFDTRSATLAYSLERFKPLAAHLNICSITESSSLQRNDTNLATTCEQHKRFGLVRDHADLCRFSGPEDKDLQLIIESIGGICSQALANARPESILNNDAMDADDEVYDLQIDKILEGHCNALSEQPDIKQLICLKTFFSRWTDEYTGLSTEKLNAWPVAIIQGPPGCGKTDTALRYVQTTKSNYGTILWLNATNRKSLELSFRGIARRMISQYPGSPSSAANFLGLEGICLDDDRDLENEDFRTIVQVVTEWLARPHMKPWLMVLDGLSPHSGYPTPMVWTGQLDQSKSKQRPWRELLRLLPSTTGDRGHIIISTRDKVADLGPEIVSFGATEMDSPMELAPEPREIQQYISTWWQTAKKWEQRVLALTLFLSDSKCPRIPRSLLEEELEELASPWHIPELKQNSSDFRPSEYLLNIGPMLLSRQGPGNSAMLAETTIIVAARAWELLDLSMQAIRNQSDPLFTWDFEANVVNNISAVLRRCREFLTQEELKKMFSYHEDRKWADMASVCEAHAEYTTAGALYRLERDRHDDWSERRFSLQLDCARVYQKCENYTDASAEYAEIFSDSYSGIPIDRRMAAYRQIALMRALQGNFSGAAKEVSRVLELEDPFGDDARRTQVTESVSELATYLSKDGKRPGASAILQRMLVSLEEMRGKMHPATLGTMEALSTMKLKEGELDDAQQLLKHVHECQKKRLGDKHPFTVLCESKIAATLDLEGHTSEAKKKYGHCLDAAIECFGPRHPAVFNIRENLVRCLITRREKKNAERELEKLKEEVEAFPSLYSDAVARRINRLISGHQDTDDLDLSRILDTRKTLGVGGFYEDEDDYSDEEEYDVIY